MTGKELIEAARKELFAVCRGKPFDMRVPAEQTDTDLVIARGLTAGMKAIEELDTLRAEVKRLMTELEKQQLRVEYLNEVVRTLEAGLRAVTEGKEDEWKR